MAGDRASHDTNIVPSLIVVSNADNLTPVNLWADPTTHALVTSGSGGGGGTQYAELATTTPATGTLALGRYQTSFPTLTNGQMNEPMLDASSRLILGTSAATIGTVTANAGTNLNTSLLALESGGNLATIATDVAPLVASSAGGYVRQDSTATIAKESGGNLATIATNTSGLATSANQTNGNGQVKITNGTNIADVVAGDSGFNGVATASGTKTYTFTTSATGAQVIGPYNVEGFSWVEVVYTSVGGGLALTGQFSTTSGGTYVNQNIFSSAGAALGGLGALVNTIYGAPIRGNYFQINVSAFTSGTFAGTVTLRAIQPVLPPSSVNAAQSGTWTIAWNATPNADAVTSSQTQSLVPLGNYNNTNWDRARNNTTGVVIAAGTTATNAGVNVTTYNASKAVIILNVSAYTSGTITVTINATTSSGYSYPLLVSAAIGATGVTPLRIFPGATASANAVANDMVPRTIQVVTTGTFSLTYGVDYELSV